MRSGRNSGCLSSTKTRNEVEMRYLERAHLEAQRTRAQIEISPFGLLQGIKNYIENRFELEIVAVPAESIQHNHAEVSLSEGALHYDQIFDEDPTELAWE